MQRFMIYALMIYIVVLALGMNFVLTGLSLGIAGGELLLFLLVTLLPAIFLLIYVFRFNIGSLESHERALHYLIYASLAVAVVFFSLTVVPVLYA